MRKSCLKKDEAFLKSYVKKSDKIFCKKIEGKVVVFLEKQPFISNHIYVLNNTAGRIWRLFNGRTKIKDIIKRICDEFSVDFYKAQKDVKEFILASFRKGLINIINDKRKYIREKKTGFS